MKIALYARVSKDDGKQDVENQLHELRQFAARSGWTVIAEYIDRASGKTADRPQFKRMFEDASLTLYCSGHSIGCRERACWKR
jgi:DNA invertase Pin-like site-specific DNA recombinase